MKVLAVVQKIENDEVVVRYRDNADCGTCRACSHLFPKKSVIVRARNRRRIALKEGDWVEVYVSPWQAVKEGFLVLILPLLLFFPFYWLGMLIAGTSAAGAAAAAPVASEAGAASGPVLPLLLGLAGIAGGFALSVLRRSPGSRSPSSRGAGGVPARRELPEIARAAGPGRNGCPL